VHAADLPLEGRPGQVILASARVYNGEGGVSASPAWVAAAAGRIVASGSGNPPDGAIDLGDAVLAPGYLDLQVNGTGDVDFATASVEDTVNAIDRLVQHGTTGVLLTLCSAPLDAYDAMLSCAREVREARPDVLLGVHLEGPFLGGAPGAHPVEVLREVDLEFLDRVCASFGDLVRIVTLAPERDPGFSATQSLTAAGIVVALGHSIVDFDGAVMAADCGARMVTHLFNGMAVLHHRAPGLAGAALHDRRLVPSVIADFVHVHPAMVKLALDIRADAVLVTDAVRDDTAYLADGTLAGSVLTMDRAVQNVVAMGVPAPRAVRHATANAARVLGISDRGRIAPGARADLVALDPVTFEVRGVWIGGVPR
jgi:N-acetylglucosamine-6-phosphate deacetylase